MQKVILGYDSGNGAIKTSNGDVFTAGFVASDNPISNKDLLEYQGKFYNIGMNRVKYKYDKTIDNDYFILCLAAIGKKLEKMNIGNEKVEIVLGIGLPLSHFSLKEKFVEYFKRKDVSFVWCGKRYNVMIDTVMCFPQAIAGFMTGLKKYDNVPFINLFDCGKVTLDCVKISNNRPLLNTAISLNYGVLMLIKRIQENVRKETGIELEEEQIEIALKDNSNSSLFFDNRLEKIIIDTRNDFVSEMLSELRENGYELQSTVNLLIGGGSSIILSSLNEDKCSNKIGYTEAIPDAQLANAKGYEMLVKETLLRSKQ
ncbi:ParM/StbA family protein [Tepidibacter formicigenes]|jgi:plasmid segregation protein ParM|uniref:Plasmid segregation actin-type ATPase ParM n=1 Tax=Tepidibacter formicigenes DSM 15518 TaxID=1123349 RepID=A0A1M6SRW7_9FIRM|nr:ParM/StbA family protein [Tepidibacter formicigenes]SHK47399.1 plasmid segregation actin-type ATPase ParM [Tepidibacter formicigenes DSM 15518]